MVAARDQWPPFGGVDWLDFRSVHPGQFDLNVYQMGNNAEFHAYMHRAALDAPGMLVLHDPSLYDFYVALCGGVATRSFVDEVEFDMGREFVFLPVTDIGGTRVVNRLDLLMSRRLVERSLSTVVHSHWALTKIREKSPASDVVQIQQPAAVLARRARNGNTVTFGIVGGLNHHKRVHESLAAFERIHQEIPTCRLLIAGRVDVPEIVEGVIRTVEERRLDDVVKIELDVDNETLDEKLLECDVLIALRWPTAGETSAILMRGFGAGLPVIASDVPQFREFESSFCWRVALSEPRQTEDLYRVMKMAATDIDSVDSAGRQAQQFIARCATLEVASLGYLDAIDSCLRRVKQSTPSAFSKSPLTLNAIGTWSSATGLGEAARRAVRALSTAGVSVSLEEVKTGIPTDPRRIDPHLASLSCGRPGRVEVCFLNVNELHGVLDVYLREDPSRYLIGYWYWELPELPPQFVREVGRFDEFWVASRFVEGNLASYTARTNSSDANGCRRRCIRRTPRRFRHFREVVRVFL